ncbi:MAG: helix-turn-helix domain-containing protein [Nevskia sp.]|nr:helix-turn-helix domain-containing protein [Nevskia sp.]
MNNFPAGRWSSEGIGSAELTDAWQAALSAGYRSWEVPRRLAPGFSARMRQQDVSALRVVECVCSPCTGRRLGRQLRQDQEPYLGVQVTRQGLEHFRIGDQALAIAAGDIVFWSSDRATEFEVMEPLHKITLMVPWRMLEQHLPRGAPFAGARLDGRRGIGTIVAAHIQALAAQGEAVNPQQRAGLQRATLELIAAAMASVDGEGSTRLSERYLQSVQRYILDHLHEADLSLERIARANRISLRYLHRLFEQTGRSVSSWIQQRRLERCREALLDPAFRHCSIAAIAARWGFDDAAHFSRIFKAHAGLPPSRLREAQVAAAPPAT